MIRAEILSDYNILIYDNTVSDSINYEKINFHFTDEWKDYQKTAVFKYGDEPAINVVLNEDNSLCTGKDECYIPHEVLKSPRFTISVFGTLGNSIITTMRSSVSVFESGYELGDEPVSPTPTEYQQINEIMLKTFDTAQSVRDDANEGLFKGDKGDKVDHSQ